MNDAVKPSRPYRSARRTAQVAQTRRDIIVAAGKLFRDRGYLATTMPLIAEAVGIVVETIYRAFGSKAGLFRAVIEAAVAGGSARAGSPVEERPAIRAIIEEPDPRRQLALYAATQPGIHRRSGPLLRALRGAAAVDPELQTLWGSLESDRRAGQGRVAGMLAQRGALRPGLGVDEAGDVIWTLCSLAVHDLLVVERGWSAERYEAWLADCLARELLPSEPPPR